MVSSDEQMLLFAISAIIVLIPVTNWLKKDPVHFWSPLTMVSLVFFYYTVVGPYFAVINNDTYFRLLEHRPFFLIGWEISLIALISIIVGFQVITVPKYGERTTILYLPFNYARVGQILWIVTILGIIGLVGTGGLVSQLDVFNPSYGSSLIGQGGAFRNYLMHSINLLVGAACLYLVATMNDKSKLIWFFFILLFAVAVFTRQGFRWRHIVLGMSLLAIFHLIKVKKINVIVLTVLAIVGVMAMGFIQSTRSYGRGLKVDTEQSVSGEDLLERGLGESSIFMTTSLLVAKTSLTDDYIGFDPIVQAIVMPIPRVLWPEKPSGDYLVKIRDLYSAAQDIAGAGAAILNYGEYYLMFGMPGLIIGCILLGIILKLVWRWFLLRRNNPLAIVAYAVFFSYIFVIISRGYLPQVFMLFMLTVFPLFWLFSRQMKLLKKMPAWKLEWKKRTLNRKAG